MIYLKQFFRVSNYSDFVSKKSNNKNNNKSITLNKIKSRKITLTSSYLNLSFLSKTEFLSKA